MNCSNPVYNLVTGPIVEPVTRTILSGNEFLKDIDVDSEGTLFDDTLIPSARNIAQKYLRRKLLTQTWKVMLDYPVGDFKFPFGQLQSITTVKIYAADGTATTESSSKYDLTTGDYAEMWLKSESGHSWVTTTRPKKSFEITFVCGWTSAAKIPADIKNGIMVLIAHLYYNRESTKIPQLALNLFSGHEIISLG